MLSLRRTAPAGAVPSRVGARALAAPHRGLPLMLLLPFMLLAVFVGMVGGLDSPPLVAIVGTAVLSVLLLFVLPLHGMFWCLFILTFLLQGSAVYFLRLRPAAWLAFGLAILFFCRALLDLVLQKREPRRMREGDGSTVEIAAILFLLAFTISLVFNRVPKAQVFSSVKAMLPMFSVLFALYWFRWKEHHLETSWRMMFWVVLLQVPVVLYQHFFVATSTSFDSIVGTFGGTPGFGGNSAIMVLFTVLAMGYAAARWNAGQMTGRAMLAFQAVGFAIILLGEVKAAFVWLPLVLAWVLRRRILRSFAAFVGFGILLAAFLGTTYFVYDALYWGKKVQSAHNVAEKFNRGGGYFFDPDNVNYRTGEISRAASLALWWRDPLASTPRRLVGYGPGASKPSGLLGAGEVARRYQPLHLDASALAILLWDVGLLGALAYGAMLLFSLLAAWRYVRRKQGGVAQLALADTCVAAMLLFLMMLVYNRALMDEPTAQLLLMMCMGTIVQLCRFSAFRS
ncbi:hypothetical protein [Pseudoduganella violaceinigra]|uniref:hypothetical protein n=1 Tax=Pseudoduganella violaceinigra TaxID=246602 RepID=UPI0004074461|nr:hypothetical protein [Pseudoduganella violaceinigra]